MENISIIGNVGKDPVMDYLPDGVCRTHFSVAVNARVKKDGEWTDETHWWDITAWRKDAETLGTYLSAGKKIYLTGSPELELEVYKNEPRLRRRLTVGSTKDYEFLSPKSQSSDFEGA